MGLLGSLKMRKVPSSILSSRSKKAWIMPQQLSSFKLIWFAKSFGLKLCVPMIACLLLSLWWVLATYPSLRTSTPPKTACAVHLESLLELFLSSVARTAPLWFSIFCLQSTPVILGSNSLRALKLASTVWPLLSITPSTSHLTTTSYLSPRGQLLYTWPLVEGWFSGAKGLLLPMSYVAPSCVLRTCMGNTVLIIVASLQSLKWPLMLSLSGAMGSGEVSLTVVSSITPPVRLSR
mmetsp:Transcript_10767/g.30315  ORF Transcript_10767/g.30315 Transcript_10767/m.30315 type:complete len:235 (+) Transcript_10767:1058-1762(+)